MARAFVRNVRLKNRERAGGPITRGLERLLLNNRPLNIFMSQAAKWMLTALLWPRFIAPYRWQLTRYPMPLAVDPAFNGYRILQLTDLHAGKTRLSYLQRVIAAALAEKPDLVVITGDLIDYHPDSLVPLQVILRQLSAAQAAIPDGIVAIFGNHDYHEYSWRHVGPRSAQRAVHKRLLHAVQNSGIRLLRNEQFRITRQDATLTLVGLDEMWTERANAAAAFAGIAPDEPVICLQHNPDGIDFLRDFPWQFMLCGHSHGGQANFPFLGSIYVPMENRHYLQGFFHFPLLPGQPPALKHRTMFVSRGIGHSTPIRMRCPPESTLFTVEAIK
jgi:predicted MPP superfamily phosphohydrolase